MARRPVADAEARILETGYRPYDGRRLGPSHAVWTLWRHTLERILGLRRPARYKVLPFLSVIIAYLPAIAFIGATALIPARNLGRFVPDASGYYRFVTAALILFATLAAPEALCPDKRTRMLGIYLASPLTRTTYLVAKAAAVGTAVMTVTFGPPLLLLIGQSLQNAGPHGFGAFMTTLEQVLLAGLALAVMFTAFSLMVPSLTDRRGLASAGSLLLILGSSALAGIMSFGLKLGDGWLVFALNRLPFEVTDRIFDRSGLDTPSTHPLATWAVALTATMLTAVAAGITWWRVTHVEVTR